VTAVCGPALSISVCIPRIDCIISEPPVSSVSPYTAAVDAGDSGELNRLILKAEKLEMGTEPLVAQAKEVRDSGTTYRCSDVI
jgi:hypothetical protein